MRRAARLRRQRTMPIKVIRKRGTSVPASTDAYLKPVEEDLTVEGSNDDEEDADEDGKDSEDVERSEDGVEVWVLAGVELVDEGFWDDATRAEVLPEWVDEADAPLIVGTAPPLEICEAAIFCSVSMICAVVEVLVTTSVAWEVVFAGGSGGETPSLNV